MLVSQSLVLFAENTAVDIVLDIHLEIGPSILPSE